MKRVYLSIVALCVWAFCLHAQNGEFDPANPGDPMPYYALTVHVSPSAGGTANITHTMVAEGQQVSLRITPAKDFKLSQWVCGDSVLGTETYQYFTMPARNVVITAQMMYEPEAFNPASPDDPQGQGEVIRNHQVTVYTSPSVGGSVNRSSFYMQEGAQERIYAYPNAGYEFVGWYVGDHLESTSNPVTITMRESDVAFTARFQFNPSSPEDPGANLFDAATGTLIIDRFTPGNLSNIVYNLVDNSNYNNVKSVIIKGEMSTDDYGVFGYFTNAEAIDISQTTGYTAVPSWAFSGMNKLVRLLLPATVETIGSEAFYGCSSLSEIVLYAPAPPALEQYAYNPFEGVDNGLIVRVPASSVSLYQASTLWGNFVILPMDVQSLNVSLPEDKVALYENMFLELLDTKSGQLRRYVITNRNVYSFEGMFNETAYQLTLRNSQGTMFGQEMVTFVGNDTTVSFTNLLQPVDISLQVLDTAGNDVTEHTTITWLDNEGKYFGKGNQLIGQAEGSIVNYKIELDESLTTNYIVPDQKTIVISQEMTIIKCKLQNISKYTITGIVIDSITGFPISGVSIAITQLINDNQKTITARSNKQGYFSAQIASGIYQVIISATDYKSKSYKDRTDTVISVELSPISGYKVPLRFKYNSHNDDISNNILSEDIYFDNITFKIINISQNHTIESFLFQNSELLFYDEVSENDSINIVIHSKLNKFKDVSTSCRLTSSNSPLEIKISQLGELVVAIENNRNMPNICLLYNENGQLCARELINQDSALITDIPDGNYSLVVMEYHNLYSITQNRQMLDSIGLKKDSNYVIEDVVITSGMRAKISIPNVPVIDESTLYYTGDKTNFMSTQSVITMGNYVNLRAYVNFKSQYASQITNAKLLIDFANQCRVVDGAVMSNKGFESYEIRQDKIIIPIDNNTGTVRLCAIPIVDGDIAINAYVQFEKQGETITQPIGSVNLTIERLALNVPSLVIAPQIPIKGIAPVDSRIEVYNGNDIIGVTQTHTNSNWAIKYELDSSLSYKSFNIHAKIYTKSGDILESVNKEVVYNKLMRTLKQVTMVYAGRKYVLDCSKQQQQSLSFSFNPADTKFEFVVEFTSPIDSLIRNLEINIATTDNKTISIPAYYDNEKGAFIGYSYGTISSSSLLKHIDITYDDYLDDAYFLRDVNIYSDYICDSYNDFSIQGIKIKNDTSSFILKNTFTLDTSYVIQYYYDDIQRIVNDFGGISVDTIQRDSICELYYIPNDELYIYINIPNRYVTYIASKRNAVRASNIRRIIPLDFNADRVLYGKNNWDRLIDRRLYRILELADRVLRCPSTTPEEKIEVNYAVYKLRQTMVFTDMSFICRTWNFWNNANDRPDNVIDLTAKLYDVVTDGMEKAQDGKSFAPELEDFLRSNQYYADVIFKAASKNCCTPCNERGTLLLPRRRSTKEESSSEICEKGKLLKDCPYDITGLIDPSGFVYEAVEDNRVQDVQATIYYKAARENIFGEMVDEEVAWDAENYGQENPLYTDAQGMYHWDVPQGLWQVRFEKDGYEPTQSEWLPVPPPQLEVNIPIVQLRQPEVANAIAHKDAIDITFDKYMMPSLLNTDNIFVTANDQTIAGTIVMLDEQHPYDNTETSYASKVRFVPASPFTASEITLTVSTRVHSYADVPLAQTFQQIFDVEDATVIEPAQTPVASITSGTVVELGAQLTLSCATEGAVIRYTMDGSEPDCQTGYIYTAPIVLYGNGSVTVKAIACAEGYDPSEVAQWMYSFPGQENAIEEVDTNLPQVSKLLRDGQLLILRGDKTYTVTGQEVR